MAAAGEPEVEKVDPLPALDLVVGHLVRDVHHCERWTSGPAAKYRVDRNLALFLGLVCAVLLPE